MLIVGHAKKAEAIFCFVPKRVHSVDRFPKGEHVVDRFPKGEHAVDKFCFGVKCPLVKTKLLALEESIFVL